MAGRSNSFQKRQKEQQRKERQQEKRERRLQRKDDDTAPAIEVDEMTMAERLALELRQAGEKEHF